MKFYIALTLLAVIGVSVAYDTKRLHRERNDLKSGASDREYMLNRNRVPKGPSHNGVQDVDDTDDEEQRVEALSSACDDCKIVVQRLKSVLKNPTKLEEMKMMLKLACDMLPSSSKDECKSMVDNIDTLAHELEPLLDDPEAFCKQLYLCGTTRLSQVNRIILLFVKKYLYKINDPERSNDIMCEECTLVIDELKGLVQQQSIQDEMKQELHVFCQYLGSIKSDCDSLVDQFFPQMIQELVQLMSNPKALCSDLGLCNAQTLVIQGFPMSSAKKTVKVALRRAYNRIRGSLAMLKRVQTKNGMNAGCVICKLGFTALIDGVKNNDQLMTYISTGIRKVCSVLPEETQEECADFLTIYLKPVLVLSLDQLNPNEICDELHVCDAHDLRTIARLSSTARSNALCEACKMSADFLKMECQQEDVQREVCDSVKQLCDVVPGRYASQCSNLIDEYVPYMLNMLASQLSPESVCPSLHLCPAATRPAIQINDNVIEDDNEDDE